MMLLVHDAISHLPTCNNITKNILTSSGSSFANWLMLDTQHLVCSTLIHIKGTCIPFKCAIDQFGNYADDVMIDLF